MNTPRRVLYLKSGQAVQEAQQLLPRLGELPDGGPDKFLLAVLWLCRAGRLRVVSVGGTAASAELGAVQAHAYATRAEPANRWGKAWRFARDLSHFVLSGLRLRPTHVLCGEGGLFAVAAWVVARLSGASLVLLCHNAMTLPGTSAVYRRSNAFLCSRADWVVAHGPYVRQEALQLRGHERQLLEFNNALDAAQVAHLAALSARSSATPPALQVVFLGRLEAAKGVFDLLQACLILRRAGCPLQLSFIGSGAALAPLQREVSRQDADAWVRVLGAVPFDAVFEHLRTATVVATPSRASFPEGFCKSAMEALFVGVPVVVPDYGPFPHLVTHEYNGLLYKADDVSSLADQLQRILSDADLHQRLSAGAAASGHALMQPDTTFYKALSRVFQET